jgi:hypothetical protein
MCPEEPTGIETPPVAQEGAGEGNLNLTETVPQKGNTPSKSEQTVSDLIPAEYKDKAYLKDVENIPSLFKKLDGAMSLIGKRPAGIPEENASKEDWEKFYAAMGRPEKAEDYIFEKPEGVESDEKLEAFAKSLFHEAGLRPQQASLIQTKFDNFIRESAKAQLEGHSAQQKELDVDFDKLATKTFGDKVDVVLDTSKKMLAENVPEEFKEHVQSLSNENLIVMASVLNSVHSKYIKEDGNLVGRGAVEPTNYREQAQKLLESKEFNNPMHPRHDAVKAEIRELYHKDYSSRKKA